MYDVDTELDGRIRSSLETLFPGLDDEPQRWQAVATDARAGERRKLRLVRRRTFVAVAAAVACIAAAAAFIPAQLVPDNRLGASPAAAQALGAAARTAAGSAASAGGRYRYQKVKVLEAGIALVVPQPHTVLVERTRETWIAADGSGRMREVTDRVSFPSARDRERWLAAGGGGPREGQRADEHFGARDDLTAEARLPTDADSLYEHVRKEAAASGESLSLAMTMRVSDLLASPAATPKLRAALYTVLTRIDGVELDGRATDSLGRGGIAVSTPGGYQDDATSLRAVVIFDPATSAVLERRTVLVQPVGWTAARPPTVIGSMTYLESGWAGSAADVPDGA